MRHRPSGQIIAVKQMRRTGDSEENKRIIMDLDVVLKSHDCEEIVLCLGAFITDSDVWICMELMSTCFDKLLKHLKAPIPEDICGKVAVATVKALNYLKERHGVIHRDVKPSNILLEASGQIKLCDFGISGRLVDSKAKTRSAGCAAYMAPERIDPPNPSSQTTISAQTFGAWASHSDCKTDFEVLTKVLTDDPPLLPRNGGFSHEFRSFVKDTLMKNFNDRPKYNKLLGHPFILKYEAQDVDVGAWYRSKTSEVPCSGASGSTNTTASSEPVTFKPQPSPRVVRSSRRPPQSPAGSGGYPSAMSRPSAFEQTSKPHHLTSSSSNRYPNGGTPSAYSSSSLLNNSSNRSPTQPLAPYGISSSTGPSSLPEVPRSTPRYRDSTLPFLQHFIVAVAAAITAVTNSLEIIISSSTQVSTTSIQIPFISLPIWGIPRIGRATLATGAVASLIPDPPWAELQTIDLPLTKELPPQALLDAPGYPLIPPAATAHLAAVSHGETSYTRIEAPPSTRRGGFNPATGAGTMKRTIISPP
ncbi:Dual specificity mitogenactivated protein kinase kinase hemipterouslike [Caligus rogercresseyi]|uniref:mitogen-activated protein kinase kinase n=1 Tax=Caligus rogercresseyi TaxID=217165 RepID=A0A7T8HF30_CALRO|nr:Dual specificity mitogenactivated protein kinase kinase hemipterouslike [Caligus rogercresseyi]